MTVKKPTLEEFLNDPKHQEDRQFMEGVIDNHLNNKIKKAKDENDESMFSFLTMFGFGGDDDTDKGKD